MDSAEQNNITAIIAERQAMLQSLAGKIARKVYFALEERLREEQQEFQRLFSVQTARQEQRQQYSFVLDPQFFEQKLMRE